MEQQIKKNNSYLHLPTTMDRRIYLFNNWFKSHINYYMTAETIFEISKFRQVFAKMYTLICYIQVSRSKFFSFKE